MKKIYWFLIAAVIVTLLILLFSFINRDRMMDNLIERSIRNAGSTLEYLEDLEGIRVITLGTASPVPSDRNQSGTAVFAGGKFFLFDVGYGVIRQAETGNLPLNQLENIFISHWHSDHFIDLPYAINRSWQLGRQKHLNIYGPSGIDSILIGINQFLKIENQHRIAHHGVKTMNPKFKSGIAKNINLEGSNSKVLYNESEVKITAFNACHKPVHPAFGFKIEYRGKSVVISGDTTEDCPAVALHSQDTDLLLHEVMLKDVFLKASEISKEVGDERRAKILKDITEYHTSPVAIGKLAQAAKVKKLVLHHFAPVPSNLILQRRYKSDLGKHYKGPISLAEDGDEYYIKVN